MTRCQRLVPIVVIALLLCLVGSTGGAAQDARAAAPAAAAATVAPSHRQAILELLQMLHMDRVLQTSIGSTMDAMLKQAPQLEPYRATMQAFFDKYFSWPELQDQFVDVYAATYTEAEVRELLAFYRTPVGQKSAAVMPQLMQAGSAIGQRQVQAHLPELQQMIEERMKQDQAGKAPPSPQ